MLSLIILRYYMYLLKLYCQYLTRYIFKIFLRLRLLFCWNYVRDMIWTFVRKGKTKMSEKLSDIIWLQSSPNIFVNFSQTVLLRKLKKIVCRLLLLCKTRNRTKILLKIDFFTYELLPRKSEYKKGKKPLWNLFL